LQFLEYFSIVFVRREPLKFQKPKKLEIIILEFHVLNALDLKTIALFKTRAFLDKSNICFAHLNHILSWIWMWGCRQSWPFCSILFPCNYCIASLSLQFFLFSSLCI